MADPHDVGEAWRALGRQLAEFRKAAGHTQHSLAPRALSGRSTIANTEVGRQHPDRAFWERCDEVLQARGALTAAYDRVLTLQQQYRRSRSTLEFTASIASAEAVVTPSAPHDLAPGTVGDEPLRGPRTPCGVAVRADGEPVVELIGAVDAVADDTVIVTVVTEGRARQVRVSRRALLQAVPGGLIASLPTGDPALAAQTVRVDPAIVEHFAVLRAVLVESDNRVGAAAILPTARQQLDHIADFRRAARGSLRDALLGTEARWAEFAGWLSDDLGDRSAGEWWLIQALGMAQEAGDAEFTAYVFARMAQRAAEAVDRDRVLGLARAAERTGSDRTQVRAFAAVQRAHGHTIEGDTHAFQAAIDDAQDLVAGEPADSGALGSVCTTPYVWAQEGDGWLRLGHPRTAVQCFDRALDAWPESYRRERGLYLARSATAYAAADEPQKAAGTALAALELARLTRSARVHHEVAAVDHHLTAYPTEPGVAELHATLAGSASPA